MDLSAVSDRRPDVPHRVLFIHHSVGGQWLASPGPEQESAACIYLTHPNGGGLRSRLEHEGYEVHETSYGSRLGDKTDLFDWLPKFSLQMDQILVADRNDRLYGDGRRNHIVIFKSCHPNSSFAGEGEEPGHVSGPQRTVANAKATMTALLQEFRKQPDVLFVYVTAPPLAPVVSGEPFWKWCVKRVIGRPTRADQFAAQAALTRRFNNWVSAADGWLKDYPLTNVVAFDYFDILTGYGAGDGSRCPSQESGTDPHPSREGNERATAELVSFLNGAVRRARGPVNPLCPGTASVRFSPDVLVIDVEQASAQIARTIGSQVLATLRRRGVVVGLSGGIDSSVCAALSVRALGADRVVGILMPERDSSDEAFQLGTALGRLLGIETICEDIAPILIAAGCYARQDEAIRTVCPEYASGWKCKITLPSILHGDRLNVSLLTVLSPAGDTRTFRLSARAYLKLVAATNFKQRARAMMAYYHADRLNYAVVGTPNRLEYDQGFFVKGGDGAADLKPIAHLYKTQVYALAAHLDLPEEIRRRTPTTDTYSMPQTQEEFYFALPYDGMDLCLYGRNHAIPATDVAHALGLTDAQVERVYKDIDAKRRVARYLHRAPLTVEGVG